MGPRKVTKRPWRGSTANAPQGTCLGRSDATAALSYAKPSSDCRVEDGALLYLRQEGRGIGLYAKLDAYAL